MEAAKHLGLALDMPGSLAHQILTIRRYIGLVGVIKVNSVFLLLHRSLIEALSYMGFKVWVDLKFNDKPQTVRMEMLVLKNMGVSFATIGLSGGSEMIKEAVGVANNFTGSQSPIVLGVTVLTSIDQKMMNEELRIRGRVIDQVLHLARLGKDNGVRGVVCSGLEAKAVRDVYGPDFFIATPGIRLTGMKSGDHKRVVTPGEAIRNGSDLIVMGENLISGGPQMANNVLAEIEEALGKRV